MLRSRGESPTILATLVASPNLEVDYYPLEFRHKLFSLIFEHIELREKQRTEHLSILCHCQHVLTSQVVIIYALTFAIYKRRNMTRLCTPSTPCSLWSCAVDIAVAWHLVN